MEPVPALRFSSLAKRRLLQGTARADRRDTSFPEISTMIQSIAQSAAAPQAPGAFRPQARTTPSQLRGILLMIGSTVFFSCSDVMTKFLSGTLPPAEIAWLRYTTFALLVAALLFRNGGGTLLRSQNVKLQILRGFGMVGSTLMFTTALRFLPVADATAIYFISPILIMALSIPFLGEVVGWRRWSAALVGLIGVMIVIRPGTGAFGAAAFLPILSASSWAAAAIVTRKMSGRDHPLTTLAYSALVGFLVLSAIVPFVWVTPDWTGIGLGLCVGIVSTIGHWLVILAYRHASASGIAPFSYVQLIWAGVLGYLAFAALPDAWTILGACIIAASGLYTAYRERVRALSRRQAQ
jgi:drug/metabolite transporter (DMT)-like permease